MKILTLNTHSLQETNYEEKLNAFMEFILAEKPEIIALQEVNQSINAPALPSAAMVGQVEIPGCAIPVRLDNHALRIVRRLRYAGIFPSWAWLPIKLGYGKYDEGVAILSLNGQITDVDVHRISRVDDYNNWRTRKVLGVQLEDRPEWFYTVHMGWWQDEREPFAPQWRELNSHILERTADNRVWLMGDFNSPAEVRGQGYDLVAASGWQDSYFLAEERDEGHTMEGPIDGWREILKDVKDVPGLRIDHIWVSEAAPVAFSSVVFSGKHEIVVSDHYGVLIETKEENG